MMILLYFKFTRTLVFTICPTVMLSIGGSSIRCLEKNTDVHQPGGAGSEVWNRVYMIAPVLTEKKFGRVRLSIIFLQNKYGGECRLEER